MVSMDIQIGSIVQSRKDSYQGIVENVYNSLWQVEPKLPTEWIDSMSQYANEVITGRWFKVSDFNSVYFLTYESDLIEIPVSAIRFHKYATAFVGRISWIVPQSQKLMLHIEIDQVVSLNKLTYLVIQSPTVTPYVGDLICGSQSVVTILADGVNYPYLREGIHLTQNWPIRS